MVIKKLKLIKSDYSSIVDIRRGVITILLAFSDLPPSRKAMISDDGIGIFLKLARDRLNRNKIDENERDYSKFGRA